MSTRRVLQGWVAKTLTALLVLTVIQVVPGARSFLAPSQAAAVCSASDFTVTEVSNPNFYYETLGSQASGYVE
jgi:nitrate/TMAO reductase-like tetraheme cytochrome c subunit